MLASNKGRLAGRVGSMKAVATLPDPGAVTSSIFTGVRQEKVVAPEALLL
jgi:hypothetical protein